MLLTTTLTITMFLAAPQQQDPSKCPLHEEHMKGQRFAGVQARGGEAAGMGFSQTATTHHFLITPGGGVIQVTANDGKDAKSIAAIRSHMRRIAASFAKGDFSIPSFVHAEQVTGTEEMKRFASEINYKNEELPAGGRVVIKARSPEALEAVHAFLNYQIREHRTADHTH